MVVDPNIHMRNSKKDSTLIIVRVSKHGLVDFVVSLYPPTPLAQSFNFLINLHQIQLRKFIYPRPLTLLQQNSYLFITTQQTIHSVDITNLTEFQKIITQEANLTDYVNSLTFPARCLLSKPKATIFGVEFVPPNLLGNGLICFSIPREIEFINFEDNLIFNPVEQVQDDKNIDLNNIYKSLELTPFSEQIEQPLLQLKSDIHSIFSPRSGFHNQNVDWKNNKQCDKFFREVRDKIVKLHIDFYKMSKLLKQRMANLKEVEEQIVQRRDTCVECFSTFKQNVNTNRNMLSDCKTKGTKLMQKGETLRDRVYETAPKMSKKSSNFDRI
eukprot:UN27395